MIGLTCLGASGSGMSSGKEDIFFSFAVVAFLTLLLGLVYLSDFVNKIRKDKDYREHLRTHTIHLLNTVRKIFQKEKQDEDEKRIDLAVSLDFNN
jgi:uncharacterized membrane protein YhiD involved in acid resistance